MTTSLLAVFVLVIGTSHIALSSSVSKSEAFFQGSCEKWNPCSQMCINIPGKNGLECQCAAGYTINADGFTCDDIPQPSSTVPPEFQSKEESENQAHIDIIHNPGKNQVVEEIFEDPTDDTFSDTDSGSHEVNLRKLAKQKREQNKINNKNNKVRYLKSSVGPAHGFEQKKVSKKWKYGNYFKPEEYNPAKSYGYGVNRNTQNDYYNQMFQSDGTYSPSNRVGNAKNKNRQRPSNRRKNGKGKGKGRKGKNRNKNRFRYDKTQSDSADHQKYEPKFKDLSNSVLEEELKSQIDNDYSHSEPVKYESCDKLNCTGGGKCVVDEMLGGVRCQCKLGTEGEFCENTVMVKYPQFRGTGYMAFPVLRGAYREFTIKMEFRPDTFNGLLVFSSEHQNARTDFISISLVDERVEFRFDCGTGPANITSRSKVQLGEWNTLTVHRRDWTGELILNDEPAVTGRSQGFFQRITFREDLYLGGYKNLSSIGNRAGMQWGFVGCVRQLTVNGQEYDMRKSQYVGDAIHGVDVGECSAHTCERVDCLNGGQCMADSADTSVCLCPVGAVGDRCESKIDIYIPSFDGTSYLQYLGLRRRVLMFTKIEITFKTTDSNGMLLYNGYRTDRTGDFMSLALVNNYLEFRFDLGTGPAIIRSQKPITINEWHTVRIERTGKHGKMIVDSEAGISGQAKGAYTQLTLTLDLFIGGHRNYDEVAKLANINAGFKGCIQKLMVNDQKLKLLEEYIHGVNVDNCDHPCMAQPCMNGGKCVPLAEKYQCRCPLGFENTNCEDRLERIRLKYREPIRSEIREPVTVPMFSGGSFLMYDDSEIMKRVKGSKIDVQMKIRPTGPNGLLFWVGEETMSPNSDYFALGLDHGHAILRYNLGSGDIIISYNDTRLDDGKWHKIKVQRYHKVGYLEIDGSEIVEGTSPGNLKQLNVASKLYIGGMPIDSLAQNTLRKFTTGFQGCIANVTLATDYHINLLNDVIDGENIKQCIS